MQPNNIILKSRGACHGRVFRLKRCRSVEMGWLQIECRSTRCWCLPTPQLLGLLRCGFGVCPSARTQIVVLLKTARDKRRVEYVLVVFVMYFSVFGSYSSYFTRIPLYSINIRFRSFFSSHQNTYAGCILVYFGCILMYFKYSFFCRLLQCIPMSFRLGLQILLLLSSWHRFFRISYFDVFHVYFMCISLVFCRNTANTRRKLQSKIQPKYI